MAKFRVPPFLWLAPLRVVGALCLLGCGENPVYPILPDDPSNLVVNGGFERPRVRGREYLSYGSGDPIVGWTIEGPIDQLARPIWGPADGSQSVDLDGSCGTGGVHQDLPTEPGILYVLRFAFAGNPNGGPSIKQVEITWGGAVVDTVEFDSTGGSKAEPGWVWYRYAVLAHAEVTRLGFRSLSPGCYGGLLDAVDVRTMPSI